MIVGFEVIWEMGWESLWPSGQNAEHRNHGGPCHFSNS